MRSRKTSGDRGPREVADCDDWDDSLRPYLRGEGGSTAFCELLAGGVGGEGI